MMYKKIRLDDKPDFVFIFCFYKNAYFKLLFYGNGVDFSQ